MARSAKRRAARPYLVMGPDIHGATMYFRCRTLRSARSFTRDMEKHWTILRIVHAGKDLLSERLNKYPPTRRRNGDEVY